MTQNSGDHSGIMICGLLMVQRSAGVTSLKNTFSGNVLEAFPDTFGNFLCLLVSWNNLLF